MTRIPLLLSLLLTSASVATPVERPNIIIVLADDLNAAVLGCYGGESARTPRLDKLAAEGMRYSHCYSPALCMPSRTELLTGKYSHHNYVGRGNIAIGEASIASELKKAGYATCQVEKWHLEMRNGAKPPQVGFDEYCHTRLAANYFDPVADVNGAEKSYPGGYGPRICQEFAFDFIRRHRERPFFIYYAMHLPHAGFHVPPGFDLGPNPSASQLYAAMVEYQDAMVGELVDLLDSLKLRERTLLFFTGDNGTPKEISYQSRGRTMKGGKGTMSDGGTHVPLIVSWPGTVPSGVVADQLVDFADFLPTAMEAAGRSPQPSMGLDGQSFFRQLSGDPKAPARRFAFKFGCQNASEGANPMNGYWARTQRWKLYGDGRFYDVLNDPDEALPLPSGTAEPAGEGARDSLRQVLEASGAEAVVKRFRNASRKQKAKP